MDTLNPIIAIVLVLLAIIRVVAAAWADSEVSEIKHVAWAILCLVAASASVLVNT